MRMHGATIMAGLTVALVAPAVAQAPQQAASTSPARPTVPRPNLRFDPATVPEPQAVLSVLNYTTAAQIAALEAQPVTLTGGSVTQITANWVSAAFFTGASRLARVSDKSGALPFLRSVAEHYNYGLRGASSPRAMINADDQAIGELYQELYARTGQAGMIMPLRQRLDYTLTHLTVDPAPKQLTWWWCDALFMAPPVLARMAVLTRDPAYLQAMDVQWWRTYDKLWDPAEGLYFRDARFIDRKSANGKKIFWGRGNGWVMGGLARVLEAMPADFASRPRYVETLRTMSAKLIKLQRPDGLWATSLLDPDVVPGPETSGSAFNIYAMAWGINHDLLDRATYLPHVLRGWAGLTANIRPNGLLGHVQRTGDQPVPAAADDHGLYGTGALLLAGLEVMNLGKPVTALPVPEPQRDPPPPRLRTANGGPAPTTPAEEKEFARRLAERQATIDLAYDPALSGQEAAPVATGDGKTIMPRVTLQLTPPPAAERAPRASVVFAPYRYDDILWENDRTAHRIYGPALEKFEPPSTSGIDAWGKNVRWPFMERQLKTGKQHDYHGEGIDFYNVNTFRGAGGLGVWQDNKLWVSRNFQKYRILRNGPDVADFEVDYAAWPVGIDRNVQETRRFTLPTGTNFTRMTSTLKSNKPGALTVGIGISKRATSSAQGALFVDRAKGIISWWGPTDADKGTMGVAIMVDPKLIADITQDADNHIVLLNVTPGSPFVYYMGATWDKSLDFHTRAEWENYVKAQTPNFDPRAK